MCLAAQGKPAYSVQIAVALNTGRLRWSEMSWRLLSLGPIVNLHICVSQESDNPIAFTEHEIELTFKDPRGNGEIKEILLDPQYRPGDASNAHFWVKTTITSPVSHKKVSETALCYWNNNKSIAVGSIEDDGGRLAIVAESVTEELKTSRFSFLVVPMSGYSGFRIAQDVPVGDESPELIGIDVKLKSPTPVLSEISFPPLLARGSKAAAVICAAKCSEGIWRDN